MKLTIVGCSGSFAGPNSPASCYLLQAEDASGRRWSLVLDLGAGAFGPLQKYVSPSDLDAVLISHLDPDHCVDLAGLRVWRHYHPTDEQLPIAVHAPAGGATFMAQLAGAGEGLDHSDVLVHEPWRASEQIEIGPFTVQVERVNHPVEAYGMRITGPSTRVPGKRVTLCFSGDTDDCPELDVLARNADLLLIEAGFCDTRNSPPNIHLTGRSAGQVAQRNGARHTVLTHIPPWNDAQVALTQARETYSGPLELAEPGAIFTV